MTNRKRKKTARSGYKKSSPTGLKLTDRQKEAVRLLCIESMKVQDTAAALGVHRTTIWRWSRKRAFRQEWDRQLKAYIREWRRSQGYDEQRRQHKRHMAALERKMNREAARINGHDTRAFDKAYKEWSNALFQDIRYLEKRLRF